MFDSHDLFKQRLSAHIKETSRYLRYIFNGHIAVAMFFLISALAVFYQQWLAQLPEDFPATWIIGITFGLIASYAPVRTLLQEPDLVFLIAAEHKMDAYFRNTLLYSFVMQLYLIFIVVAALGPLYFHAYPERSGRVYLLTLLVILIFKVWNILANWWMLKVQDSATRRIDLLIRLVLNCTILFFFVNGNLVLAGVLTVVFALLLLYNYSLSGKQSGIAWELLVEKDQNRMQLFYRLANMFTDVPHLKNKVKKRMWLVSTVNNLPFTKKYTYDYLYRITFIRSGDYLGMYIRLIILGGLFIYYVPNQWMKVAFAFLFLYMSIFQMVTLYQHYRTNMWIDLYPIDKSVRQKAIIKWLFQLAFLQTVLFAFLFVVIGNYQGLIVFLISGTLFNVGFINGYVKRKLV